MTRKKKQKFDEANDDMAFSGTRNTQLDESNDDLASSGDSKPVEDLIAAKDPEIPKEIISEKQEPEYIKPVCIVIPYVQSTARWDELLIAVRSIAENAKFPVRLFIISDKLPEWASDEVSLIESKQVVGQKFAKAFDSVEKLRAVIADPKVDEEFIYTYDDTVFISPSNFSDYLLVAVSKMISSEKIKAMKSGSSIWKEILANTFERLKANKLPTFNYETHLPRIFVKAEIDTVIKKFGFRKKPYLFSSIYFNFFNQKPIYLLNEIPKLKADIREPMTLRQIDDLTRDKLFLNYNDNGLNENLKLFLSEKFSEKCRFER